VLLKIIWPRSPATNVCKTLLSFLIPVPLKISSPPGAGHPGHSGEMLKVKESELEANTMLFSSTEVEMFTSVCDEGPKVAISDGPFGGPPAVQLLRFS